MKIVVDAQLPPALAGALCEAGEDAIPVREVGLREAEDDAIWEYALKNSAAVVTKDEDFAERAVASHFIALAERPLHGWKRQWWVGQHSSIEYWESDCPAGRNVQ